MGLIATVAWISSAESTTIYTYQLTSKPITEPVIVFHATPVLYSVDYLKGYVGEVSIKYGLSAKDYQDIMKTIQCESGFKVSPRPNGISWGIAQFTKPTWKQFGHGDIMNPKVQIEVMISMWSKYKNKWDCFTGLR